MAILASFLLVFINEYLSNIIFMLSLALFDVIDLNADRLKYVLESFPIAYMYRFIEYWIIFAILTALDYQKKYRDKQIELAQVEQQLSNAQLQALKGQLEPHFLFNTLNTISSLMEINVKNAQKVVSQLGALLRTALEKNKRTFIPFREELQFIKNYLDIEQVRFQDRLEVKYNIDAGAKEIQVPSLVLQPLVENAIRHGFAKSTGEGLIEVIASEDAEQITISIKDNGKGTTLSQEQLLAKNKGLKAVEERLKLLYKNQFSFTLNSGKNNGFEVLLKLPRNNDATKQ